MKVHKYQIKIYDGIMDFTHGLSQTQTRVYIPERAVIGYRSRAEIDFFSDDEESINHAKQIISGEKKVSKEEDAIYLGQFELPQDLVEKLVSVGKSLNRTKLELNESGRKLIDLLGD